MHFKTHECSGRRGRPAGVLAEMRAPENNVRHMSDAVMMTLRIRHGARASAGK